VVRREAAVDALFSGADDVGRTDALLVQQHGAVVLERYGDDVDASTTLRSWSMAKSMLHACVGMLVEEGRLSLDGPAPVPAWSASPDDPRRAITLRHLLTMQPGLEWAEEYSLEVPSDVVAMLFGRDFHAVPDVAAFAADKPLVEPPGTRLNYSSGTSNIISSIVADVVGRGDRYEAWLRERLFGPLGMDSATPRFDDAGTWIASSYCFCTARDFAKFGQLYLDDGMVGDARLLSADWVATARTATGWEEHRIHTAHWWRFGDEPVNPWGAFHCSGFEGQYIVVVPPLDLVVVRLGQTTAERDVVEDHLRALIASFEPDAA
jgi:CubicO group peptidase (beta-lactamase class C family)